MLTDTWLAAEQALHGLNEQGARELLNLALGTKYTHGNIWRWKHGTNPAQTVRNYMLRRCLGWYLTTQLPNMDLRNGTDLERAISDLA
jgi:hypothetical protein